MTYRGYTIENEYGHYLVISPTGVEWREDTVRDALNVIDEEVENEE